jgi:hypothetical protein
MTRSLRDGSDTLFEAEIQETNVAIRRVLQDIPEVCVSLDQRQDDSPKNSVEDCQDLTEIAAKIVHTLSSVASNEPIEPLRTTQLPTRPTFKDWESASVSGVPLGFQTSRVLQEWSDGIEALAPQSTADQWWAPSRAPMFGESQADMNSQRIAKASSLFREGKFKQAVPWLEKSLRTLPEQHPRRINVQLMLAKCLMEIEPLSPKAETLLSDVVNNSTHDQNAEALGLLAVVRKELYPNDLTKAKESCELAISARRNVFGSNHEKTLESISLMIHLCKISDDIDATLWQEHLPDDLASSGTKSGPPLRLLRAFSPFNRPNSASQPGMQRQLDKIKALETQIERYQDIISEKEQALNKEKESTGSAVTLHNRSRDELAMAFTKLSEMQQRYNSLQSEHAQLKATRAEEASRTTRSSQSSDSLQQELETERQRSIELRLQLESVEKSYDKQLFAITQDRNKMESERTEWRHYHESEAKKWELHRKESRERMQKVHTNDVEVLQTRLKAFEAFHKEELKSAKDKLTADHQAELLLRSKQQNEDLVVKLRLKSEEHASELERLKDAHENDLKSRLDMLEGDHVAKMVDLEMRLTQSKAELQAITKQLMAIDPRSQALMQAKTPEQAAYIIGKLHDEARHGWHHAYNRFNGLAAEHKKVREALKEVGIKTREGETVEDTLELAKALVFVFGERGDAIQQIYAMLDRTATREDKLATYLEQRYGSEDTRKKGRLELRRQEDERPGQTEFHKRPDEWQSPASTPDSVSDPGQGQMATPPSSADQRNADEPPKAADRVSPSSSASSLKAQNAWSFVPLHKRALDALKRSDGRRPPTM